jgi:hypothetical protein
MLFLPGEMQVRVTEVFLYLGAGLLWDHQGSRLCCGNIQPGKWGTINESRIIPLCVNAV